MFKNNVNVNFYWNFNKFYTLAILDSNKLLTHFRTWS